MHIVEKIKIIILKYQATFTIKLLNQFRQNSICLHKHSNRIKNRQRIDYGWKISEHRKLTRAHCRIGEIHLLKFTIEGIKKFFFGGSNVIGVCHAVAWY